MRFPLTENRRPRGRQSSNCRFEPHQVRSHQKNRSSDLTSGSFDLLRLDNGGELGDASGQVIAYLISLSDAEKSTSRCIIGAESKAKRCVWELSDAPIIVNREPNCRIYR